MKRSYLVLTLLMVIVTACGPSPEDLQATAVVETEAAATDTPEPTSTPKPSHTPTQVPPTVTPTDIPEANLFGNFELVFVPYTNQAVLPEPPIDITLEFEPASGGELITYQITDTLGKISLNLPPGDYWISSLVVESPSISSTPATLFSGYPLISVLEGDCVYFGRISLSYYRFPAGGIQEQNELITDLSSQIGREVYAIVFSSGSLVPESANIDLPPEDLWPEGAADCQLIGAQW